VSSDKRSLSSFAILGKDGIFLTTEQKAKSDNRIDDPGYKF